MVRDDLYDAFAHVGYILVLFLQLKFQFMLPKKKLKKLYDALKIVEMMSYVI
jgi:hypothetical protein